MNKDNSTGPGGEHYKAHIQVIDLIDNMNLNFYEGTIIKYVARHRLKNGLEDLKKAKWYLERLIENAQRKK